MPTITLAEKKVALTVYPKLFVIYEIVEWEIISKPLTKCRKPKLSVYLTGTLYLYLKNLPSNVCEHRREVPRTSGNTVLVWVFHRHSIVTVVCVSYPG